MRMDLLVAKSGFTGIQTTGSWSGGRSMTEIGAEGEGVSLINLTPAFVAVNRLGERRFQFIS